MISQQGRFDECEAALTGQRWTVEQADALTLLIWQGAACEPSQEFPEGADASGSRIAARVTPLAPAAKAAGVGETPAADLSPACTLGAIPHGPVWTALDLSTADDRTVFRIVGPGIAIDLPHDQAAGLSIALRRALDARGA